MTVCYDVLEKMVVERTETKAQIEETFQTDAVRIVVERRRGGEIKLLFQRKQYLDAFDRPQVSWDLPLERTEDESPETTIDYMTQRMFGRRVTAKERIWQSKDHAVYFRENTTRYMVDAFYRVRGIKVSKARQDLQFLRPQDAISESYGLPEATKEFLQENYLKDDK